MTENGQELVNRVSDSYGSVSEHKAALFRLNKARVAFKHHGISVSEEDAIHFRGSVRAFLTETTRKALGLDFERASLVSAIGHRRTENWLHKAEEAHKADDYAEAMKCAAVAFHIYLNARSVHRERVTTPHFSLPLSIDFNSADRRLRQSLTKLTEWALSHFEELHKSIDFLRHGLDIMAYWRFLHMTPNVAFTMAGSLSIYWGQRSTPHPTKTDAEFCIDFVVDSALRIGARYMREDDWRDWTPVGQVEVCEDSVVSVYPKNDSEVIRSVSAGEELTVVSGYVPKTEDYVAILQDGGAAYVRRAHVRLLTGSLQ